MSRIVALMVVVLAFDVTAQETTLQLGNEPWPPFMLEGEEQGTAAAQGNFTVVPVQGSESELEALRQQEVEVAIVDELFTRELLESDENRDLVTGDVALAYRDRVLLR